MAHCDATQWPMPAKQDEASEIVHRVPEKRGRHMKTEETSGKLSIKTIFLYRYNCSN